MEAKKAEKLGVRGRMSEVRKKKFTTDTEHREKKYNFCRINRFLIVIIDFF